jgi:hypothetical protein
VSIPSTASENPQLYLNISSSERGLSELSRGRCIVSVRKEQIQSVEIKFGSQAERPLPLLMLGLILAGIGIVGVIFLKGGGFALLRMGVGFVFFGGLGAFCIYEALKKGYYLHVICPNDSRKLVFKGTVQREALSEFIDASNRFGYNIRYSPSDKHLL